MPTELTLRPATRDDLAAVSEVHLAARAAAVPTMPALVHTPEQVRAFHASLDLEGRVLWVAEAGAVVAYAEVTGDWLDDLYVHPDHQGAGVGTALLEVVKSQRPDGFCLWVFASNEPARRFYARHGLVELETTDGRSNEEQAPDVRLAWPGRDPVTFFRRLIDEVDDELGDLLSRRAALTRATQPHKPDAARDPDREAEVVARLTARAPALGADRVARIVHAIITESLAAAGPG